MRTLNIDEAINPKVDEYHVASFVAQILMKQAEQIQQKISQIDGAEVHALSEEGKLVFTIEGKNQRLIGNRADEIKLYDGVLSLAPIYHQYLTEEQ
jgi:nitrate reductase NapD